MGMGENHTCSRLHTVDREGKRSKSASWSNTFLHMCYIHVAVDEAVAGTPLLLE